MIENNLRDMVESLRNHVYNEQFPIVDGVGKPEWECHESVAMTAKQRADTDEVRRILESLAQGVANRIDCECWKAAGGKGVEPIEYFYPETSTIGENRGTFELLMLESKWHVDGETHRLSLRFAGNARIKTMVGAA